MVPFRGQGLLRIGGLVEDILDWWSTVRRRVESSVLCGYDRVYDDPA